MRDQLTDKDITNLSLLALGCAITLDNGRSYIAANRGHKAYTCGCCDLKDSCMAIVGRTAPCGPNQRFLEVSHD